MRKQRRFGMGAVAAATVTILLSLALSPTAVRAASLAGPSPARVAASFVGDTNILRAGHGLPPLSVNPNLTALAESWSAKQAATGDVFHNLNMFASLSSRDWLRLNENVGMGPDQATIEQALEASPDHRANLINPRYTDIGVGVSVTVTGTIFVTEDFGQAARSAAAPLRAAPSSAAAAVSTESAGRAGRPSSPPRSANPSRAPYEALGPSARLVEVIDGLRQLDLGR